MLRTTTCAIAVAAMLLAGCKDSSGPTTSSAIIVSDGVPVTGISGNENSRRYYKVVVPANATGLRVETDEGSGDVDLLVRYNRLPTLLESNCESFNLGNEDGCEIDNPTAGDWYIMLFGAEFGYSGARLTVTITP
jgi:hypothetical protein